MSRLEGEELFEDALPDESAAEIRKVLEGRGLHQDRRLVILDERAPVTDAMWEHILLLGGGMVDPDDLC